MFANLFSSITSASMSEEEQEESPPSSAARQKGTASLLEFWSTVFAGLDSRLDDILNLKSSFSDYGNLAPACRQFFEPMIAGIVLTLILSILDAVTGNVGTASSSLHFVKEATEHAKPVALNIGLILFAVSLVASGGEISTFLRKLVVAPLLRLAHHLTMVAFGAFVVLYFIQAVSADEMKGQQLAEALTVSLLLFLFSFCAYVSELYIKAGIAARLETYRTFRWLSVIIGSIILIRSRHDITSMTFLLK